MRSCNMKKFLRVLRRINGSNMAKSTPPLSSHLIVSLLALGLCFAACQRESFEPRYPINAEAFSSGAKMAVSGRTASWVEGDKVKVNVSTATVSIAEGQAYLSGNVQEANNYRAVYPASIVSADTLGSDQVTVTLPSYYTYTEVDGAQQLALPMAAASREFPLSFKHLTAGLVIEVVHKADYRSWSNKKLYLDRITVSTNGDAISGPVSFDITDVEGTIVPHAAVSASDSVVQIDFPSSIEMPYGSTKRVVVPVLPVSSGNKFHVSILAHLAQSSDGTGETKILLSSRRQAVGGSLGRNLLAFASDTVTIDDTPDASDIIHEEDDGSIWIHDVMEWNLVMANVNSKTDDYHTKTFRLASDLDFNNAQFTPIKNFAGVLDGKGHTISNIKLGYLQETVSGTSYQKWGIFTDPSAACTIKNLTVENVTILGNTRSYSRVAGVLMAYTTKTVTIDSCAVNNCTINSNTAEIKTANLKRYFGTFIGWEAASCTITNSLVNSTTLVKEQTSNTRKCTVSIGGLVGWKSAGTLTASNNTLTGALQIQYVKGYSSSDHTYYTGAILGRNSSGSKAFSGNNISGYQLTKPNGTSYTNQTSQECSN